MDDEDTVVVVSHMSDRVVEWKRGAKNGTVLAGGNGKGKRLDQLTGPLDGIFFDKETDSIIICDNGNRRGTHCSRRIGTQSGETIINNIGCWGLAMDDEGSLYVTDYEKH